VYNPNGASNSQVVLELLTKPSGILQKLQQASPVLD
jgi:hypothetical protein